MGRPRKKICSREEFTLVNNSGVEGFELEAEHESGNLLTFACDDEEGQVTIFFDPSLTRYEVDLTALRKLLDDAEADILERRRVFQLFESDVP